MKFINRLNLQHAILCAIMCVCSFTASGATGLEIEGFQPQCDYLHIPVYVFGKSSDLTIKIVTDRNHTFNTVAIDDKEVLSFPSALQECELDLSSYLSGYMREDLTYKVDLRNGSSAVRSFYFTSNLPEYGGVQYLFLNEPWEGVVIGCVPNTKNIFIQDEVWVTEEYSIPITQICSLAFNNSSMESISIPESITNIDYDAFKGCDRLIAVTFDNSSKPVYLKNCHMGALFQDCPVQKMHFGRTFSHSPNYGFNSPVMESSTLKEVTWGEDPISIDRTMFHGCTALRQIDIPENVSILIEEYREYDDGRSDVDGTRNNGLFTNCSSLESTRLHLTHLTDVFPLRK